MTGWGVVAEHNGHVPAVTPLVVVSGPTATGKTTAAAALAAATGVERWTASDRLVAALSGGTKAERLRSWLVHDTDTRRARSADADRATDLGLLADVQQVRRPVVVESAALPLLLPPDNTALLVRLAASLPVRAARLRLLVPALSEEQARTILTRKDRSTRAALRAAWGVDPEAVRACQWRADLVVTCPDPAGCPNPAQCAAITAELITAAYRVYRHYVAAGLASVPTAAVEHLTGLIDAHRTRVRRCTPLLTDRTGPLSVARWQRRLVAELDGNRNTESARR